MTKISLEEEIENFEKFYHENLETLTKAGEYYRSLLTSLVDGTCELQSVSYRVKDKNECINKFKRKYHAELEEKGEPFTIREYISDLIGLRIICLYETDIQEIRNILSRNFKIIEEVDKIKSLESTDNQFGYKSLHFDLELNDERKKLPEFKKFSNFQFEVQIRTIIQDAWSVLDHKIKYKKTVPPELKRRINRLSALFEIADSEFLSIKRGTESFEKKALKDNNSSEPLNVISFLFLANEKFPTFQFFPYKADAFVHEITALKENITPGDLIKSLEDNLDIIKKYNSDGTSSFSSGYMNPFVTIRYCLYLSDRTSFDSLLFRAQKHSFEQWLSKEN